MECYHCRLGQYQTTSQPYLSPFGETMMVVPQVPALRCDICGHIHYDEGFLQHLQYLLDRLGEHDKNEKPHALSPVSERDEAWQTGRRIS